MVKKMGKKAIAIKGMLLQRPMQKRLSRQLLTTSGRSTFGKQRRSFETKYALQNDRRTVE